MSTIPNVSSVYRDLAHIYSNADMVGNKQAPSGFSLQPKILNEKTCFQDMYAYKQRRHNQLLSRLQNSTKEHQNILNGFGESTPTQYESSKYNYQSEYNARQSNYQQPHSYISNNMSQTNRNSNFVMPKLKYRHIEDERQKNLSQNVQIGLQRQKQTPNYNQEAEQLQKQFYQDDGHGNKLSAVKGKNQRKDQGIGIQTKNNSFRNCEQQDGRSEISNRTNTFIRSNKNSKYEDKIESYYDLCRKNITRKPQEPEKTKQQKFIRGPSGKNKAMKLDEAIKLLSLD